MSSSFQTHLNFSANRVVRRNGLSTLELCPHFSHHTAALRSEPFRSPLARTVSSSRIALPVWTLFGCQMSRVHSKFYPEKWKFTAPIARRLRATRIFILATLTTFPGEHFCTAVYTPHGWRFVNKPKYLGIIARKFRESLARQTSTGSSEKSPVLGSDGSKATPVLGMSARSTWTRVKSTWFLDWWRGSGYTALCVSVPIFFFT